jgi:hypothetical protein
MAASFHATGSNRQHRGIRSDGLVMQHAYDTVQARDTAGMTAKDLVLQVLEQTPDDAGSVTS